MGRPATVVLVVAVVLLGVAAVVDALRDGGTVSPTAAGDTTTATEELPRVLRSAGLSGTILYTDATDCRLHALALPALRPTEPDREARGWESCGLALDAAGRPAPEGTVFPPDGDERQAMEFDGGVELVWPSRAPGVRFENARAPAFRADGTLTFVRDGRILAFEPCAGQGREGSREWPGYCAAEVTTEAAITESLDPRLRGSGPGNVAVLRIVWISNDTMFVVAQSSGDEPSDLLLRVQGLPGARPIVEARFQAERISDAVRSPNGRYVAVLSGTGRVAVLDPSGRLVARPGLRVRALSWSPDDRWLAVLSGPGLVFVRLEPPVTQIGPILLSARDVGWR